MNRTWRVGRALPLIGVGFGGSRFYLGGVRGSIYRVTV
jgi:hypothetical protein